MPGRTNFFVICPDNLGLNLLLTGALSPIASSEDLYFYDASNITKEKARQIEEEARFGPRAGSPLSHFFIYSTQQLPSDSVGPLLKAVEESKFSRFIFQSQYDPPKIHTLMSRSSVVRLPFLSKRAVLANMKAMHLDARAADTLDLYDGTLSGTVLNLKMKDTLTEIRRETKKGLRGQAALYQPDILGSLAFTPAVESLLDSAEKGFIARATGDADSISSQARKKIALHRGLGRPQ